MTPGAAKSLNQDPDIWDSCWTKYYLRDNEDDRRTKKWQINQQGRRKIQVNGIGSKTARPLIEDIEGKTMLEIVIQEILEDKITVDGGVSSQVSENTGKN